VVLNGVEGICTGAGKIHGWEGAFLVQSMHELRVSEMSVVKPGQKTISPALASMDGA